MTDLILKISATIQSILKGLLLIGLLIILQSCVSEDELDFPDEPGTDSLSQSVAIVSTLRAIESNKLQDSTCFLFLYPLELQFNNNISVTVSDFNGLKEVASSVTQNQHINAIEFPFLVSKNDMVKTIDGEQDFINLLDECEIPTLRDEFDPFYTQCFDLVYPLKMLDADSNEVTIPSQEAYFDFELDQGFDKQPKFIYPISLFDYSTQGTIEIETPFEIFEIFDTCKKCPELFFFIDTLTINRFQFTANFDDMDRVFSYDWYINNQKIETDGNAVQGDNKLTETFETGEYTICIKASLPEDDCFSGTEYCQTIAVDACPFVSYETEQINATTYKFIANFSAKDLLEYHWAIYQNQDLIFNQLEDESGDNLLTFQFEPGAYEVCIEAENEGCPEVLRFCTEVIVE